MAGLELKSEDLEQLIARVFDHLSFTDQMALIGECNRIISSNKEKRSQSPTYVAENLIWEKIIDDLKQRNGMT
jgi:hypothetical protein